eukprot:1155591-Pelagomonas_calceolata.AAC.2
MPLEPHLQAAPVEKSVQCCCVCVSKNRQSTKQCAMLPCVNKALNSVQCCCVRVSRYRQSMREGAGWHVPDGDR